uniref:Uncharacterized protein n=1 Tax=Arion vulgaris TaxID=1028688 RepID=A0A0B7BPW6_9EUPU
MFREGLEHLVTTGKIQGRRNCGRQREKMLYGLISWFDKISTPELINYIKEMESCEET